MDAVMEATLATVQRFNDAFNRQDVDAIMELMTDDCVFENTYPPPDGERFEGQAAVRAVWEGLFSSNRQSKFDFDDMFACGNRCVVRWTYHWTDQRGQAGHIRGVDIMRVREGKVAEKLSYVKG